jgi:hypothetical protein
MLLILVNGSVQQRYGIREIELCTRKAYVLIYVVETATKLSVIMTAEKLFEGELISTLAQQQTHHGCPSNHRALFHQHHSFWAVLDFCCVESLVGKAVATSSWSSITR